MDTAIVKSSRATHYSDMTTEAPHHHTHPLTRTLSTVADLRDEWQRRTADLTFTYTALWFTFLDSDNRTIPTHNTVDLAIRPDPAGINLLMRTIAEIIEDDTSVAFLLVRAGDDNEVSDTDSEWARLLGLAAREHEVHIRPTHRANNSSVVTVGGW